jgi:hypothetical protein
MKASTLTGTIKKNSQSAKGAIDECVCMPLAKAFRVKWSEAL